MEGQRKPLWVSVAQGGGSALWMVLGAYLGPRLDFGPPSELLRGALIAVVGITAWWWAVFVIWLCTRGRGSASSRATAEPGTAADGGA